MSSLSLGWSAQPTLLGQALYRLRDSCPPSTDVTLYAENGNPIRAHRVVLAAFSQYFEHVLNRAGHPSGELMVLVPNVQHSHLQLLLKYMYEGSVDVPEEDFSELNRIAKMLKVHMLGLNTGTPSDRPNTPMDSDEMMMVDSAQTSLPPRPNQLPVQSCLEEDISQNRMCGRGSASKYHLSQKRMKVQKQQAEYQKKTEDLRFQKYHRQRVQSTHVSPLQTNLPSEHISSEQQALQEQQLQTWENQRVVAQEQHLAQGQEHLPAQTQKENQQVSPTDEVVILEQQEELQAPGKLLQPQQACGQQQKKAHRQQQLQTSGHQQVQLPVQQQQIQPAVQQQQIQPPVQQQQIQPPVQQQQIQPSVQQQQIQPSVQQQQIQPAVQQQQPAQLLMQQNEEQRQQELTQTQKAVQLRDREQQTEKRCELIKLEDDEDGNIIPPALNSTPLHPSIVTQSPSTFLSSICNTSASCSTTPSSNTSHLANISTNQSHKNVPDRISSDERQSRGLSPIPSSLQSSNNRRGNEIMETPCASPVSSSHIPPSSQVPLSLQTQVIPNSSHASTSSETSNHSFEQSSFRQSPSQILLSSSSLFPPSPSNEHRLLVMGSTSSVVPSSVSHISTQPLSSDVSSKTFVVPLPPTPPRQPAPTAPRQKKILSHVSRPGTPIPRFRSSSSSRMAGRGNVREPPTPLPSWCQEVEDICSEESGDSEDSDVETILMNEEKVEVAAHINEDRAQSPDGEGLIVPMSTWNNYEKSAVDNGLVVAYQESCVSHITNYLPPSIATEAHPVMTSTVVSAGSPSNLSHPSGEQQEVNDYITVPPNASLGHVLRKYWHRGVRSGAQLDVATNDVGAHVQDALPDNQEDALPVNQEDTIPNNQEDALPVNQEDTIPNNQEDALPEYQEDALPEYQEDALPDNQEDALPDNQEEALTDNQEESLSQQGRNTRSRGRGQGRRGRGQGRGRGTKRGHSSVSGREGSVRVKLRHLELRSSREPNNQVPHTRHRSVFFKGVERTRKTLGRSSVRGRGESVRPVEKSSPGNRQASSIARRVNAVSAKNLQRTAPSQADATSFTQQENEPAPEAEAVGKGIDAEANLTHGDEASNLNAPNKTSRRNPYICNFCGDGFPYKASLALHKKHHHQLITCRLCDSGFTTHRAFTQHKRWHQNLANNSLPTYYSNTTLDDGVQDRSGKEDNNETSHLTSSRTYRTNVFSGKLFSCSSCRETFTRRVLLLQHRCQSSS